MPHTSYDARDYAMAEKMAYEATTSNTRGGLNGQSMPDRDRTTLDDVYGAMSEANALANRVMVIVDRLCGSTPVDAGKGIDTEPYGIFPTLRRVSGDTLESVRNAQSALNRLDRELP